MADLLSDSVSVILSLWETITSDGVFPGVPPLQAYSTLIQDHRNMAWDSKHGFTIKIPTFSNIGLLHCEAVIDGVKHNSRKYFVHRTGQHLVFTSFLYKHINIPKVFNSNLFSAFSHWSQWVTSQRFIWTPADQCRPWRGRGLLWTALPPQSWTPESTSPGTILERSDLLSAGLKRPQIVTTIELWLRLSRNGNPPY